MLLRTLVTACGGVGVFAVVGLGVRMVAVV